jgi:hypothetical protein
MKNELEPKALQLPCPKCNALALTLTGKVEWIEDQESKTFQGFREYECTNCGNKFKTHFVTLHETLELTTAVRGKIKDKAGHVTSKFLKREKLSRHGKKAVEELHIDIKGDRKLHHVEEKNKNGTWKTVHHEDEKLKKRKQ